MSFPAICISRSRFRHITTIVFDNPLILYILGGPPPSFDELNQPVDVLRYSSRKFKTLQFSELVDQRNKIDPKWVKHIHVPASFLEVSFVKADTEIVEVSKRS